jgi:hypothetical protein
MQTFCCGLLCEFIDLRLCAVEIVNEPGNDGVHLVGIVAITPYSGECMSLSGSSTDHVVNLPGSPPM